MVMFVGKALHGDVCWKGINYMVMFVGKALHGDMCWKGITW